MSDAENSQGPAPPSEPAQPKGEGAQTEHINLRVQAQDGTEVFFKIKKTTPMRKLMDAYCQRSSVARNSVRFLLDGVRVTEAQTPKELGLEDQDVLDVVLEQTGGCGTKN